jgi:hypothetical protein
LKKAEFSVDRIAPNSLRNDGSKIFRSPNSYDPLQKKFSDGISFYVALLANDRHALVQNRIVPNTESKAEIKSTRARCKEQLHSKISILAANETSCLPKKNNFLLNNIPERAFSNSSSLKIEDATRQDKKSNQLAW